MAKHTDLIGQRFGRLTVISKIEPRNHRAYWLCECECGRKKEVSTYSLRIGKTKSCGCLRKDNAVKVAKTRNNFLGNNPNFKDLTGKKFSRLTVVSLAGRKGKRIAWNCVCECGKEKVIAGTHLVSKLTVSCGCYHREKLIKNNPKKRSYSTKSRIYRLWEGMRRRCRESDVNAEYYFKRGISICKEWDSYESFHDWAVNNGYDDSLTLDRIDNNKGYFPENCRWATMKTQCNNRRTCHFVEYKGQRKTISEWADNFNVSYGTMYGRVKYGRPLEGKSK